MPTAKTAKPARKAAKKKAASKKPPVKKKRETLTEQQRVFCDHYLSGKPAFRAYQLAGYNCTDASAYPSAARLLRNVNISEHIEKQRAIMAENAGTDRDQLIGFLVRAIHTPLEDIDAASELCQEHHVDESEFGTKTRLKAVSKLEAAKQLAALMGWNKPIEIQHQADDPLLGLLARIRSTA